MATRRLACDYRRVCWCKKDLSLSRLFEEHGVVAFDDGAIKGPSFALAHKMRRRGGWVLLNASLFFSKLDGVGNGLEGGCCHVEQHFSQMGAAFYAANVRFNGPSPSSA